MYVPSRRPAPAVILVHMLTRHRGDWHDFATRLAEAGIGALAIDLRGHGAPGSTPNGVTGTSQDLARSVRDVEAARRFLRSRPDLFTERVGMAGASIGANLALLAAQNDASVASLVMLSPGLDYRGLRSEAALGKYGSRPVLLVASEEDPYALRSARRLAESGPGIRELRTVSRQRMEPSCSSGILISSASLWTGFAARWYMTWSSNTSREPLNHEN